MIKANELRLENIILYKGDALPVYMVDRAGLSFSRINDVRVNKISGATLETGSIDFEPIPLTPEWLERLGFVNERRDTYCIGAFEIWIQGKQLFYYESLPNSPEIKYVHQLQNLFFALTGKELTVKEPK